MGNGCFTILLDGAYFLSAVMVEGDESSRQFWPATDPVWFDFILGLNVFHCFKLITIPQNKGK